MTLAGTSTPSGFSGWESVWEREYDNGYVGDSRLTSYVRHLTDTEYTEYNLHRNWRGGLRGVERLANGSTVVKPHRVKDVDWQGRAIASALAKSNITEFQTTVVDDEDYTTTGIPGASRLSLVLTACDDLGHVYQTDLRPAAGGVYHRRDRYYDRRGNVVATGDPHAALTEYAFDGAGRLYQSRVVKEIVSSPYSLGTYRYAAPTPDPDSSDMTGATAT